jgi:hypothetical protein
VAESDLGLTETAELVFLELSGDESSFASEVKEEAFDSIEELNSGSDLCP